MNKEQLIKYIDSYSNENPEFFYEIENFLRNKLEKSLLDFYKLFTKPNKLLDCYDILNFLVFYEYDYSKYLTTESIIKSILGEIGPITIEKQLRFFLQELALDSVKLEILMSDAETYIKHKKISIPDSDKVFLITYIIKKELC